MKNLVLLIFFIAFVSAEKWAFLVAGSSGYDNYRHQADVCHMYHVLTDHSFNQDHIITFMADDLARSAMNPFRGKIFNKNGNNSRDYYEGTVIDYSGFQLSSKLFLAILRGDEEEVNSIYGGKNNKVLRSTENDEVFIYYINHGGQGLVMMPNDSVLFAKDLISTLKDMNDKKMFKKLVFYLEACESGSMWLDLPKDINVYAISSTDNLQSSWGTYCPGSKIDDVVDGISIGSCLGEVFSCAWLEQDDEVDISQLTLQEQFDYAKQKTSFWSTPQQFGDLSFTNQPVSTYISEEHSEKCYNNIKNENNSWNSRNNKLNFWNYRKTLGDKEAENQVLLENQRRSFADQFFRKISIALLGNANVLYQRFSSHIQWDCYIPLVNEYNQKYGWNDYSLQYTKVFASMCSSGLDYQTILKHF
ncbi:hypothetical protein WA158_008468 [Blastocystis sp. Blastoise]